MPFSLAALTAAELESVAGAAIPEALAARLEPGALPPPFIAARSLALSAQGTPAPWARVYLIVRSADLRIVGSCGFKTALKQGRVEVGYGVAPGAQRQGAATAALRKLVHIAFEAGATEVLAEVAPDNEVSARVARKAGFAEAGFRVDEDNEFVIQWLRRSEV
jgi:RimJ/RimL family protein N-acetyltransferase